MSDEFLRAVVYGIGWAVCIIGGIGLGAALTTWAIDQVLSATKTTLIVARWWLAQKFPRHFAPSSTPDSENAK